MTENQKHRLNAGVIEFVNQESEQRQEDFTPDADFTRQDCSRCSPSPLAIG
jgi:hypothetical protein